MQDKVELVLENCEAYTFDIEDVDLYIDGLGEHWFGNDKFIKAEHIAIVIHGDAKAEKMDDLDDESDWQHRIDKDITQIHLDGKCYWPVWEGDYENIYETDIVRPDAHIYIMSKSRTSLEEFE